MCVVLTVAYCVPIALVSASFSPGSTTTSAPSSQGSNTLPRPAVPMSPRNSLLKRRHRKKDHKSSRESHSALSALASSFHVCLLKESRTLFTVAGVKDGFVRGGGLLKNVIFFLCCTVFILLVRVRIRFWIWG